MNNYEVLYVVDGTLSDEAIKEQVTKFSELVTANGGEIVQVDEWGKRRLAYQINYKSEGYYVLMNFKSEPGFPVELERNFGINESVMRYMVERKSDDYVPAKKVVRKPARKPVEAPAAKPVEAPEAKVAPEVAVETPAAKPVEAPEVAVEAPAAKPVEAPEAEAKEETKEA